MEQESSIVLPSKPRVASEEEYTGVYEIDGLYPGYGYTLGNALRRILLSSLPGAAVTEVKIDGVEHMFSTVPGVKEDVIAILLNMKQMKMKMFSDEPQVLKLEAKGAGEVKGKDFKTPTQVEITTPDLHIATITDKNTSLSMEATVERGIGYRSQDAIQKKRVEIGSLVLDAVFSPVRRVNYEVENMRIGERTDYNRLRITIQTDGTITPREALENAVTIMIRQLKAVLGVTDVSEEDLELQGAAKEQPEESAEEQEAVSPDQDISDLLKVRIEELNFSGRVLNALSGAGIRTVGGLVKKTPEDLMNIDGIGEKATEDIRNVLKEMGLALKESE